MTFVALPRRCSVSGTRVSVALLLFQVPLSQRYRDSPVSPSSSLVRVFPQLGLTAFSPMLPVRGGADIPHVQSGCVFTVTSGGFSVHDRSLCFPSFGPRGFLLHTVTRFLRPRLISTTRESAALCSLPASASRPYSIRFSNACRRLLGIRAGGFPWVRLYDLPTYRPPTHRFDFPDIGSRLFASARPSPRSHLGGSLFATYAGLPHASSPRSVSARAVALLV